jgi:hypothetical protein
MVHKMIVKKLSLEDLNLFKHRASKNDAPKANGIRLDHNVLVGEIYPSLPEILENKQNRIMMTLNIFGPGVAQKYCIQRRIQKKGTNKNYFLNGEFIADPEDEPERFHVLQPGDIVILEFFGDFEPYSARVFFVAHDLEVDNRLHKLLDAHIGTSKSMIALRPQELEQLIADADLPEQHPATFLVLQTSLEDAALGGMEGIRALRQGPFNGRVSRQVFDQAKKNAQRVGRLGEELIFGYFEVQLVADQILEFRWEADENAISPYDFSIQELDGSETLIDVKATRGNFNNRIHVSFNELLQMQDAPRYDIYRVFNMADDSAKLRIAENLKEFAQEVINVLHKLPPGVQVDSISFDPADLAFGEIKNLTLQVDED